MFICLKAEYPQRNIIKKFVINVKTPKIINNQINVFTGFLISSIFFLCSSSSNCSKPIILVNSLIVFPAKILQIEFVHPEKKVHKVPIIIKNISSFPLK